MAPLFQPGTRQYAAGPTRAIYFWPAGNYVFGRIRGNGLAIWQGITGVAVRNLPASPCYDFGAVCCPDDTELVSVQCFEAYMVVGNIVDSLSPCYPAVQINAGRCGGRITPPDCGPSGVYIDCDPSTGPSLGGNIQSLPISSLSPLNDMEAIGFTVAGGSLLASSTITWTGHLIPALVGPDGVTFPSNGFGSPGQLSPPYSNFEDAFGGQIWMGKFQAPDGSLMYVVVVGGATTGAAPEAPDWTCVMPGSGPTGNVGLMHVFVYTPPSGGGGGGCPCSGGCRCADPPPPPPDLGSGPCFSSSPDDVVTDICKRAGLTACQIDTSLLTDSNISPSNLVQGFAIERPTPASDVLKTLMQAYIFDACESDGTMRFVPRGLAAALTIPEADLGLVKDKYEVLENFDQAQDLPQTIAITYQDPLYLYEQGKQQKQRQTRIVKTKQQQVLNIPMVMDPDWAAQVAEKLLYLAWLERQGFQFNLGRASSLLLDPTDVIEFVYQGLTFTIRITENSIGRGFAVEVKGVNENTNNYLSSATGGVPPAVNPTPSGGTPTVVAPTSLELFDIPLIRDSDANPGGTGKYAAFSSVQPSRWPGAQLFISSDDASFDKEGDPQTVAATFGFAVGVLANPSSAPWSLVWDTVNTLTVMPSTGSFAGDSAGNVLAGSNWLIVGEEIIGFQTAVENMDGSWTFSNLLRGLRGTEWACGFLGDSPTGTNSHVNGELVVALSAPGLPLGSAGVIRYADSLALLNQLRYYRGVTLGQDLTTTTDDDFTITGKDLSPYAPIKIGGAFDGSGNLVMTWQRRTRVGGDNFGNQSGSTFPLSEDSELYDVEILNGSSVVRTISGLTTPTAVYTTAQQTADFGTPQSSYAVNVYQRSAQVGRGFKGHGTAPASNGISPVYPASGSFYVNAT